MLETVTKKRKVSKKTKKSWRKHVDTKDVDRFLENERLEERLGTPFAIRKDAELFAVDRIGDIKTNVGTTKLTKQQRRELLKNSEPKCFAVLKPHSAVSDPITKRNRVRTPEERKSSITKQIDIKRKLNGQLKLKERVAIKNKLLAQKKRANKPKRGDFKDDVWKSEPLIEQELKSEWLTNDVVRHTLANTGKKRKRLPATLHKKTSALPSVTVPHPGTSYNPSFADHQELLALVAADEIKLIKEEKHLNRVTSKMFRKISQQEKHADNLREMSEGLSLQATEQTDSDNEDDSSIGLINRPVKNVKKTLIQRRKQKEEQKVQHQRYKQKIEKKKIADIYHLKQLKNVIAKKQEKAELLKKKRINLKNKKALEPKMLSRHKFEPLEQEFQMGENLTGNLRNTEPTGNLLKDRYKSLQQRNIIAPGILLFKSNKARVKKFIKDDHKITIKNEIKK